MGRVLSKNLIEAIKPEVLLSLKSLILRDQNGIFHPVIIRQRDMRINENYAVMNSKPSLSQADQHEDLDK